MKKIMEQDKALQILSQTVWYPKCREEVLSAITELKVKDPDLEKGLNLLQAPSMPLEKLNLGQHILLMLHELTWLATLYWTAYERMPTINPKQSPLNKPKYQVNRLKAKLLSSKLELWKGCAEYFDLAYSPYSGWTKSVQEAKQAQVETIRKLGKQKKGENIKDKENALSLLKKSKNPFENRKGEVYTHRLFKMALKIVDGYHTPKSSLLDFEKDCWEPFLGRYKTYKSYCRTGAGGMAMCADKDGNLYIQKGNKWEIVPILEHQSRKSVVPSKRQLANSLITFE